MRIAFIRFRKIWILYAIVICFGLTAYFGTKSIINQYELIGERARLRKNLKLKHRNEGGNGLNVIVGHYIGTGNLFENISKDLYNTNNYAPIDGEGENGKPVVIPAKDILRMQQQFQINRFNLLASDRISLNRTLPDVRRKSCLLDSYVSALPSTTIIIVFHNEAWSVLMRTVWSVIRLSPKHLLKEILLVDDASERVFLGNSLDEYVQTLPVTTKVLRLRQRSGLVAARLLGADYATGDVLTFLDAHCECTPGWLEPLLARIAEDRRNVVCPVIDIISDDNFGYVKSFELHSGGFNWKLHFRWYTMNSWDIDKRKFNITNPFPTPTMAGGLFSIDKDYFFEIGSYDADLKIWGGDNLEMSFRIWQCGGKIEIVPCSHVGHLFRKSSPYTFPGGVNEILNENLVRVALVWMDDWADFYFKFNPQTLKLKKQVDVTERLALRETLKCKSFDWYLRNIWPNHFLPATNRFFGKIVSVDTNTMYYHEYIKMLKYLQKKLKSKDRSISDLWMEIIKHIQKSADDFNDENWFNDDSKLCIQKPPTNGILNQPFGQGYLSKCGNSTILDDMFIITDSGQIMTDEGVCLDSPEDIFEENDIPLRIISCMNNKRQQWFYDINTLQIRHQSSKYCLEVSKEIKPVHSSEKTKNNLIKKFNVVVNPCSNKNSSQKWILHPYNWK